MNSPQIGIGVLIFDHGKLLLGQRKQNHGQATWGPPGGHLEFGESFEACAFRETQEETGLIISNPEVIAVTNDIFEESNKHYVSIFLRAIKPSDQTVKNLEEEKVHSWEWFNIQLIPEHLFLPLKNLLQQKRKNFLCKCSDFSVKNSTK